MFSYDFYLKIYLFQQWISFYLNIIIQQKIYIPSSFVQHQLKLQLISALLFSVELLDPIYVYRYISTIIMTLMNRQIHIEDITHHVSTTIIIKESDDICTIKTGIFICFKVYVKRIQIKTWEIFRQSHQFLMKSQVTN